jgi:iron complex outermembrane receptor protein
MRRSRLSAGTNGAVGGLFLRTGWSDCGSLWEDSALPYAPSTGVAARIPSRRLRLFASAAALVVGAMGAPAAAQSLDDLGSMSIDDLAQVNVTSVSKTDQPLSDAPAAIYVISREDIERAGAVTLPEMLRLAPNLQVYQTAPGKWAVTARGLNGNRAAQNFSNKLLVLVDGRTVYTPLFSGVYWDMPDVLPDNVDRIEVISGPGATLFGSNAVNGVINVITRNSAEVAGAYADLRAGPERQAVGLRFAGQASDTLSYSLHGRFLRDEAYRTEAGLDARDPSRRVGGGFRVDWAPSDTDAVMLTGELFDGRAGQPGTVDEPFSGRNLTARWNRRDASGGEIQVQAFYDRIARDERSTGGAKFHTDTFDIELQNSFTAGERHKIVWGAGARLVDYDILGSASLYFDPARDHLFIADIFAQDSVALTPKLTLVAGLKAERLPDAGVSLLPEVRLAWKPAPTALIWAAASRAVRSPTPFDTDVEERVGIISISGNPDFLTEKLTAFELGTRLQPSAALSLSATLFYHRYDDLRSIELLNRPGFVALGWGNNIEGDQYGVDAWADIRATRWWTIAAGATVMGRDFDFKPGGIALLPTSQVGQDPPYWLTLRSSMNPLPKVTLDLDLRAVGKLHDSTVPAYRELGGRLAWEAADGITLSLSGTNLLHKTHQEYPGGDRIERRVLGGLEMQF